MTVATSVDRRWLLALCHYTILLYYFTERISCHMTMTTHHNSIKRASALLRFNFLAILATKHATKNAHPACQIWHSYILGMPDQQRPWRAETRAGLHDSERACRAADVTSAICKGENFVDRALTELWTVSAACFENTNNLARLRRSSWQSLRLNPILQARAFG